jgi:hypothetical protein
MSVQVLPVSVKPARHTQRYDPGSLTHEIPVPRHNGGVCAHSLMSTQRVPPPVRLKPGLHVQENDPGVLVQVPLKQGANSTHSLISTQGSVGGLPRKPGWHFPHVKFPTVLVHTEPGQAPLAHSSMSKHVPLFKAKPGKQPHSKDPGVLKHVVLDVQGFCARGTAHSLMSLHAPAALRA